MAGTNQRGAFRLSPVDPLGRKIDSYVLAAAEEIGERAVRHGEKLLGDPALLLNLLEETAATVSRAVRLKKLTAKAPVRNLHAYLFRSFIRRVNRARRKDPTFVELAKANPKAYPSWAGLSRDFELKVLIDEFLTSCDDATRDMFYRRVRGFSWKEIGKTYGISSHAAESRFGQALQRVRKKLKLG